MRRIHRRSKTTNQSKEFQVNQQIRAEEVFLIDKDNENIGIVPLIKARALAKEAFLDLVEVNPKAQPPVVKIMDLGQFRYKKEKEAQKQKVKQKKMEIKGVRLSVRISQHDFDFRVEQAKKFLAKGNKLKIDLVLKGREKRHPGKADEIIDRFIETLKGSEELNIEVEQDLTKQGGRFNIVLINKP